VTFAAFKNVEPKMFRLLQRIYKSELPDTKPVYPNTTKFPNCQDRLRHLKELGFYPKVIFDCGAFIGKWAAYVSEIYPKAKFILIEPNVELSEEIKRRTFLFSKRVKILNVAVADKIGEGSLNVWDNPKHNDRTTALAASSLLDHVQGIPKKKIDVRITTLDNIAEELGKSPDVLKLDLQGGEYNALLGANKILETVELCIIEFGCLEAYIDRTTPRQLMDIMYDNGFCLYDIVDMRYRPFDGALAGGDFFFLKTSSKLREHKDYF
jgi:FkbM family methyltransferase